MGTYQRGSNLDLKELMKQTYRTQTEKAAVLTTEQSGNGMSNAR